MRIAFLGTGDFGVPALRRLRDAGHELTVAVSQPDRPAGRGLSTRPTAVHAAADALGVRHIQTEDVNALPPAEVLAGAELAVVAAFGQKIGPALLAAPRHGMINIHGSLLPKYRGAAPFQWAILNGDEVTGVTVFQLNERWDAGAILGRRALTIGAQETATELHDRLAILGAALVADVVREIELGTLTPEPQDAATATRARKLSKRDSQVDWSRPAHRVVRWIHGLWSWPAAACVFAYESGKREVVQLVRAEVADPDAAPSAAHPPGAILPDLTIQADPGRVRLLEVKPAGGRAMRFVDFANGRALSPATRIAPLESP